MTLPNFVIVGAAKCGTDALYAYLGQHPQIYLSPTKETNFFVVEGMHDIPYCGPRDREILSECWVTSLGAYEQLFAGADSELALGEASPWYLYDAHAAERIAQRLPNARLIAILRNPVDRAFSAFTSLIRDGRETTSDFSQALSAEPSRIAAGWEPLWHLKQMGFYHEQLHRYYARFDPAQLHIVIYDDFINDPAGVVKDLLGFLGVDDAFVPDMSQRPNVSVVPRDQRYHDFVTRPHVLKELVKPFVPNGVRQRIKQPLMRRNLVRPVMDPRARQPLMDVYRDDILKLELLLGRDLSAWLRVPELSTAQHA